MNQHSLCSFEKTKYTPIKKKCSDYIYPYMNNTPCECQIINKCLLINCFGYIMLLLRKELHKLIIYE